MAKAKQNQNQDNSGLQLFCCQGKSRVVYIKAATLEAAQAIANAGRLKGIVGEVLADSKIKPRKGDVCYMQVAQVIRGEKDHPKDIAEAIRRGDVNYVQAVI